MKPLSREEELLINRQAATVAMSVLSEAVVAATRCEPFDKASAVSKQTFAAGTITVIGRTPKFVNYMRTADLPSSFILAVTAGHVYALEDKRDGGQLVPGGVLKAWDRNAVLVRLPAAQVQRQYKLPDDRQVILLWLPVEKGDPLPRAAELSGGAPHKFIVARDAPSQRVIDALPPAPKGQFIYRDVIAGATAPPSHPSVAQRLQELETLRATGVITDTEYTAKRQQIIREI